MAPAKADLAIYQGDDYRLGAVFTAAGEPVDLTGWTFAAQIRAEPADDAPDPPAAEFSVTIPAPLEGRIAIELDHADCELLPISSSLRWDLQGTDDAGIVTTYIAGKVKVTGEITRP